jgi:polyphenol oxidase
MGMLLPDWPAAARVHARCSLREGGVSSPPYESLNLGDHVGDAAEAVTGNRARFAAQLHARPVFMKQVHGWEIAKIDAGTPDGIEADACWTREAGVACTIMVADCLPVLFADASGEQVGAAHCGWRGLAGEAGHGVLEALHAVGGWGPEVIAWLGPCIGPEAFEVGPEVRAAFVAADPGASALFKPQGDGKFLANLPGLARRRLAGLGVERVHGNDGSAAWCTVSNPSRFFSHRRDRVSGRFAACIWLS